MITIVFLILGAIFNSVQDTLYSHYSTSVFRKRDPKFWKALDSWIYAPRILGYPIDAWHISKSLFLGCTIGAIVFYTPIWGLLCDFLALSVVWNIVFDLFYGVVFYRPKKIML